jgi:hypothetical protein
VRFAYNGRLDLAHARQVHVCACAIGIELRLVSGWCVEECVECV